MNPVTLVIQSKFHEYAWFANTLADIFQDLGEKAIIFKNSGMVVGMTFSYCNNPRTDLKLSRLDLGKTGGALPRGTWMVP